MFSSLIIGGLMLPEKKIDLKFGMGKPWSVYNLQIFSNGMADGMKGSSGLLPQQGTLPF